MKLFRAYDIKWDTDGKAVDLPDDVYVRAEDENEVVDYLSDEFGFCVFGFDCEKIKD